LLLLVYSSLLRSQTFVPNYDEAKVPAFVLPDPLVFSNGKAVNNPKEWSKRRVELLQMFEQEMYGNVPAGKVKILVKQISGNDNSCNGMAIRKEIQLMVVREGKQAAFNLLIYLPKSAKKSPVFLGYNFSGNHTVSAEPGIQVATAWVRNNPVQGIADNRSKESLRGSDAASWPVSEIISRGYGVATLYYGDVDPDFNDGFKNGVHALFTSPRDSSSWGSIAAWAWGLSRVMDYLENMKEVDRNRVIVIGHSRLGKAALWAGAKDERFAVVISNESGSGGAALSRRKYGETVARTNSSFPHWFCDNFKKFSDREETLPLDQHELLSLIAPRPVYVSTAEEDRWGDPKGSFLACMAASPVYQLLGKEGFPGRELPPLEQPVNGTIGYHIRPGKHNITFFDWNCFMNFTDSYFKK
jgi:hypothetical protein